MQSDSDSETDHGQPKIRRFAKERLKVHDKDEELGFAHYFKRSRSIGLSFSPSQTWRTPQFLQAQSAQGATQHEQDTTLSYIRAFEGICRVRATRLREDARHSVHVASRSVMLHDQADALQAEADTWKLLRYLYYDPTSHLPLHYEESASKEEEGAKKVSMGYLNEGIRVLGSGGQRTTRERVAEIIDGSPELRRCAQVVAWLESLSRRQVTVEREHGAGPLAPGAFTYGDGLWRETALAQGPGQLDSGLVTELDPDAPTRQRRGLDSDNEASEARLLSAVFRLLRSGMYKEARELLASVGQSWRAAVLGGAGSGGPTPVGHTVAETLRDADEMAEDQEESLLEDVEAAAGVGAGPQRALWRLACFHAAESVGAAADDAPAGVPEAAIFGLLAGHEARVLPACLSWEDVLWAVFRCWLEVAVDSALAASSSAAQGPTDASAPPITSVPLEDLQWPPYELTSTAPRSAAEAMARVAELLAERPSSAYGQAAAGPAVLEFREIQRAMILQWTRGGPGGAGPLSGPSLVDTLDANVCRAIRLAHRGFDARGGGTDASPPGPWVLLRFSSHALALLSRLDPRAAGAAGTAIPPGLLTRALGAYAAHLIAQRRGVEAAPYLGVIPEALSRRDQVVVLLDDLGLDLPGAAGFEAANAPLYRSVSEALQVSPLEGSGINDVLETLAATARCSLFNGPLRKARAVQWLLMQGERDASLPGRLPGSLVALCNVGRDAALYATDRHVAALPSTAGDVKARGTLFTAEDSVLARLQELYDVLSPSLPPGDASAALAALTEALQWRSFFALLDLLDRWRADVDRLFPGGRPGAALEADWAAGSARGLRQSEKGRLVQSGEAVLEAARDVLREDWMVVEGEMSDMGEDAPPRPPPTSLALVALPYDDRAPDGGPLPSGTAPPPPLLSLEKAERSAASLMDLLRAHLEPQGVRVGVAPRVDEETVGSAALRIELVADPLSDAGGAASAFLSLAEGALAVMEGSSPDIPPSRVMYVEQSSPTWVAREVCRRRALRFVLRAASAIRARLVALGYLDPEAARGHGSFVAKAAAEDLYDILTPADAVELLEAERRAALEAL